MHPDFVRYCLTEVSLIAVSRIHETLRHVRFVCDNIDNLSFEDGDKVPQGHVFQTWQNPENVYEKDCS
jgi:hypothetical protein